MSSYTSISSDKLSRLIGTVNAPMLVDVRIDHDFAADPRLSPGAVFLFVASAEVQDVAERSGATPFDIGHIFWSHRGGDGEGVRPFDAKE